MNAKLAWSTCLGNFFEHYDTALFGFLSPFLAPLIFPDTDPMTALILTYAMIPLGMIARPLGALIFGYIGDTYGRKQALFLTLGGMSSISGCIALSPTYMQAGLFSPIIFCLGRFLQNFFAAGETMGGAIFLLENAPEKKHDFFSSLYNSTTIGGYIFASAGVAVISHFNLIDWGWRLLYSIGCLTGFFGFVIRKKISTNAWPISSVKHQSPIINQLKILWNQRIPLLHIIVNAGFAYASFTIALVLINGFLPFISSVTKSEMMHLNTWLLVLDFCTLPFFGWLSSRISREKVMFGASLGAILSGIPLFILLPQSSFIGIIVIRIILVFFGVAFFAPFHAWAQQIVPKEHRYAIISFGYALGSQLLGGPTAAISLWSFKMTGMISSAAWYWLLLALLSSLSLVMTKKRIKLVDVSI